MGQGFGTTIFFLSAIVTSLIYLRVKGIRQNAKSLVMLGVAVAASLPFALYGFRGINLLLILFTTLSCLLWVMYSCRTSLSQKLSGLIVADVLNQVFVAPFANFPRFFTQPPKVLRGSGKKAGTSVLLTLLSIIVCTPILLLVISLLSSADEGFRLFLKDFEQFFSGFHPVRYTLELIFGIPLAAYIFGAVFGNAFKRHTSKLNVEVFLQAFQDIHLFPKVTFYIPLALLAILYGAFFILMYSYLFSGLHGQLPVTYTCAEYARQGFFELCVVAFINLVVLAMVWLFAKRGPQEHPRSLRCLSGLLALLTCVLVVTAISKMWLYMQTYSLTPLRVYTSWFMILLLLVFLLLVAWHVKPFNVARPIIVLTFVFALGLGVTNTSGIIADYNVNRYLSGQTATMDVPLLSELGDSAIPALYRLEQDAPDSSVREEATRIIIGINEARQRNAFYYKEGLTTWNAWQTQNLQSLRASWLYSQGPER